MPQRPSAGFDGRVPEHPKVATKRGRTRSAEAQAFSLTNRSRCCWCSRGLRSGYVRRLPQGPFGCPGPSHSRSAHDRHSRRAPIQYPDGGSGTPILMITAPAAAGTSRSLGWLGIRRTGLPPDRSLALPLSRHRVMPLRHVYSGRRGKSFARTMSPSRSGFQRSVICRDSDRARHHSAVGVSTSTPNRLPMRVSQDRASSRSGRNSPGLGCVQNLGLLIPSTKMSSAMIAVMRRDDSA